jgi:C-terminal processing protease CtpA/Prc
VVDISQQKKGAFIDPYVAGNVGAGVLKRFNVTFDYGRQRLIFEPNANNARPDTYDRAGMWINRGSEGFEVVDVVAGGPAEVAGVKVGDRITAIGGMPAGQLSLPVVRERFRTEAVGTPINLAVRRDGKPRNLKLVLRDLVPEAPGEPVKPIS